MKQNLILIALTAFAAMLLGFAPARVQAQIPDLAGTWKGSTSSGTAELVVAPMSSWPKASQPIGNIMTTGPNGQTGPIDAEIVLGIITKLSARYFVYIDFGTKYAWQLDGVYFPDSKITYQEFVLFPRPHTVWVTKWRNGYDEISGTYKVIDPKTKIVVESGNFELKRPH